LGLTLSEGLGRDLIDPNQGEAHGALR
jgi:hypothetical protein